MALKKLEKKYFGTNGARGVTGKEINPEFALGIAAAYATVLGPGKTIGVGRDTRTSSLALSSAVKAGIAGCGGNVVDFGILPIPALQYLILTKKLDGGVMITASHNPPEYNGIKLIDADGTEVGDQRAVEVEQVFINKQQKTAEWDKLGDITEDNEAYNLYIDAIVSGFPHNIGAGVTIAIDPGSGAACKTAPEIFRRLGCTVNVINSEFDGHFPGRLPEPSEEGLHNLSNLVVASGAAFGIAHDGDADRAVFVDENGAFIDGNIMLALLSSYFAEQHPGGEIVTPVSSSMVIEEAGKEFGCTTVYTVIGSPYVARTMREELDAGKTVIIGGEGNGGIIYPHHQFCRDGGMSGAVLLALLVNRRVTVSSLIARLPKFTMYQEKRRTSRAREITEHMQEFFKGLPMDTRDGIRIVKGTAWALIRPSGTEPLIRVITESRDADEAKALMDDIFAEINPYLS